MSSRSRALPTGFIAPCLPTKGSAPAFRRSVAARDQARRFRVIARKDGARVRLYSRPGNDLTKQLPA